MGVAMLLIIEKPNFQNFSKVKIFKISFVSSFLNVYYFHFMVFWKVYENLKFSKFLKTLKISTQTRFALDCEIFQNIEIFWDFFKN